jgi:hypothetical protein
MYKQVNSIELRSAKSKRSINFHGADQELRSMIYDFATAGTDGESDEDLEEGFFTADPSPLANREKNTDINSTLGSVKLP